MRGYREGDFASLLAFPAPTLLAQVNRNVTPIQSEIEYNSFCTTSFFVLSCIIIDCY